jgi:Tfp pilus assembly protein PilX
MIARALIVAAFTCCAVPAMAQYESAAVTDLMSSCRASDPPQCFVTSTEDWQAKYRERCTEAPEQCTFRPDGTISSWSGKLSTQAAAALRAAFEHAQPRDAHMGLR